MSIIHKNIKWIFSGIRASVLKKKKRKRSNLEKNGSSPKIETIFGDDLYKKMKKDADLPGSIFLTSLQPGNPSSVRNSPERRDYFLHISNLAKSKQKNIHRLVWIDSKEKADWVKESIENFGDENTFKIRCIDPDKYPNNRCFDVWNIQLFGTDVVYIIDPKFSYDADHKDPTHIRIQHKETAREFHDAFDVRWRNATDPMHNKNEDGGWRRIIDEILEKLEQKEAFIKFSFLYNGQTPNNHPNLTSVSQNIVTDTMWRRFSNTICTTESHTLIAYTENEIKNRWECGNTAIAVEDGDIISHISLKPMMNAETISRLIKTPSRHSLKQFSVLELATGWTRQDRRKRGINRDLRDRLIYGYGHRSSKTLFLSFCKGGSASPVLSKMGWHLASWNQFPFVSSLIGWFYKDTFYKVGVGELKTKGIKPYNGKHRYFSMDSYSDWGDFFHLWTDSIELMYVIDEQLKEEMSGNLREWRAVIKMKFGEQPLVARSYGKPPVGRKAIK